MQACSKEAASTDLRVASQRAVTAPELLAALDLLLDVDLLVQDVLELKVQLIQL